LERLELSIHTMEEIALSAAVGIIIGVIAIAIPTLVPKADHGKKDDDASKRKEPGLKLSVDKVMQKSGQYPQFQQALGLTDDDIRNAVEDVNRAQSNKDEQSVIDLEPVNWAKVIEWIILTCVILGFLWFMNIESKGEVLHWFCTYFPREMSTLGFESTYVRPTANVPLTMQSTE
jgi:hypothetical protein